MSDDEIKDLDETEMNPDTVSLDEFAEAEDEGPTVDGEEEETFDDDDEDEVEEDEEDEEGSY